MRTLVLGLFAAATVSTLLALFVVPGGSCDDSLFGGSVCDLIDQGHGFGYWLALLGSIAGTALAALARPLRARRAAAGPRPTIPAARSRAGNLSRLLPGDHPRARPHVGRRERTALLPRNVRGR